MSTSYFKGIRELLENLGYPADHLCEEKMQQLVDRVKHALANDEDIDELLKEAIESATPPSDE